MSEQHPTTLVLGATGKTGMEHAPITGRPGRTFRDFARKNAAAWSALAS
jgi:hypothetical protein